MHFPREVAEAALVHASGDETRRAYRRGDALAKRRDLMDAWARFCAGDGERKAVQLAERRQASCRAAQKCAAGWLGRGTAPARAMPQLR
jgi:hypothetical protein